MNTPAIVFFLLLCAALLRHLSQRRNARRHSDAPWPLCAKRPLPSPEQVLYLRLVQALPGHIVLAGVEVAAVLGARHGLDARTWRKRLRHLHYDFVVCAQDATVLAAIALDAPLLLGEANRSRSEWVRERASAAAGVRLMRWQKKALPEPSAIRALFVELQHPSFEQTVPGDPASWWPSAAKNGRQPPSA